MKYDIIVVGGGFAGVGAAIAAARQGKKVMLIEKSNALSGAANVNLVMPFMPYRTRKAPGSSEFYILSRGIFEEICKRTDELGGMDGTCTFHDETLKIVLNRMMQESGAEVLFNATVTGVSLDGRRVKDVTVYGKGKTLTLEADMFIDCTGDANLSSMAGFPYRLGREPDHLCQPMTLCFRLAGVETDRLFSEIPAMNAVYAKYQAEGKIRDPRENLLIFKTTVPGVAHFNSTRIVKLDPTDPFDVTKAEIEAREQMFEIVELLKKNFTSCKNAAIVSSAVEIGARESRMIDGEYLLTGKEIRDCCRFDDSIAVCNYDIDIHNPEGSGTSHYYFPAGQYYEIPYRTLVPKNAENLLVAGRCISVDHEAQASIRIMPTVCCLGEAAGVAAAVAHGTSDVKNVDIKKVQDILVSSGAVIH